AQHVVRTHRTGVRPMFGHCREGLAEACHVMLNMWYAPWQNAGLPVNAHSWYTVFLITQSLVRHGGIARIV
ncbi:MAG: hypothetical protein KDE53_00970, partial [Caldilineaceae bacterium]|nr:hypothetical protein [Caldilineaceae bacterium]